MFRLLRHGAEDLVLAAVGLGGLMLVLLEESLEVTVVQSLPESYL